MAMVYVALDKFDEAEEELLVVVALEEAIGHPDLENDRNMLAQIQNRFQ